MKLGFRLFLNLTAREIRNRLGYSGFGIFWLVVNPILLLSVYAFVFGVIFKARSPEGLDYPFIVWLALGLWPWLAFSDSTLRASQAIRQHSALISKISINRSVLVFSVSTAQFLLHLIGYSVVLVVIQISNIDITWQGLPYALITLISLYIFIMGLGLILAGLTVFIKDLDQLLPVLFMLWFFLTPILYAPTVLPPKALLLMKFNPMAMWVEELRSALTLGQMIPNQTFLYLVCLSAITFWLGLLIFRRLSPYFEDFL